MDEMTAFERQLAGGLSHLGGVGRRVDPTAMTRAVATQSPKGRFQTMFSALKFAVAGAIVALFGGFLLAGVLTQPGAEQSPAGAGSVNPSSEAPTPHATPTPQESVDSDILPGVKVATEEVGTGTGVFRVLDDGVRSLSREIGANIAVDPLGTDAYDRHVSVAPEGSVWYFGPDGLYELGDPKTWTQGSGLPEGLPSPLSWGTDGTIWAGGLRILADGSWTAMDSYPDGSLFRFGWATASAGDDVWVLDGSGRRANLVDADGWTEIEVPQDVGRYRCRGGSCHGIVAGRDEADLWLITDEGPHGELVHFDGSEWSRHDPASVQPRGGPILIDMAPDGTLWAYFRTGNDKDPGYLGRYRGESWTVFTPEDGLVAGGFLTGVGARGLIEAAPDGRLWLTVYDRDDAFGCDGVVAFDGETFERYLRDECVYSMDAAPDGSLWLLAGPGYTGDVSPDHIHTYVITPEG